MNRYKERRWVPLDNAAKIFPSTSNKRDTRVFRFACELFEPVDPALLQQALDQTIKLFPGYRSILKRGLFWYYLEASDLAPLVVPEQNPPCSVIFDGTRRLLFEVSYYKNRINLELYHVLADGTGALMFLKELVLRYLVLKNPGRFDAPPSLNQDASASQRMDDSFQRYRKKGGPRPVQKEPNAYQLRGPKWPEYRFSVMEGLVSTQGIKALAKMHHATVTVLLSALFIQAIGADMPAREKDRPVVLTLPVNLRQFFPSESARNFFSVVNVGCNPHTAPELDTIIDDLNRSFSEKLDLDNLQRQINQNAALEHSPFLRVVPLVLKDPIMGLIYRWTTRKTTAALSNVGRVEMPPEVADDIRLFDVFTSTNRLQLCLCSYRDNLVLNFTSPFEDMEVQKRFFRLLSEQGLTVTITTNLEESE